MTIGDRVRILRGRKNLSELGKILKVSGAQISKIESEQAKPSIDLAIKICDEFHVSLDWLLRGIDPSLPENMLKSDNEFILVPKDEFIELQRKILALQDEKIKGFERK